VHEAGSPEDDYSASEAIARAHPNVRLAPAFANPSEAKTYIAGLDFFMGARMHACIAAFSSGVPVIPMAYSRKFAGLFGSLGYDHTVDCTTEDADAIHDRIVASFHDRERLVKDLNRSLRIGQEKLGRYQDALAALIASVR
jgi:polysaccharide pyruvyl transferase WcaK-like protein